MKLTRKRRNSLLSAAFAVVFVMLALTPLLPEAEISTRLMLNVVGIDTADGTVRVTAQTMNGTSSETVHGEGLRIGDALEDIAVRYGREPELGHCGLLVFGYEVTADDTEFALMGLLGDAIVNAGCSVVCADGTAEEFVNSAVGLTSAAGDSIADFAGFADTSAAVSVPSALEVLQHLKSKSATAILPVFELAAKKGESGEGSSQNSGTDSTGVQQDGGSDKTEILPPRRAKVLGRETFEPDEQAVLGWMWISERAEGGLVETRADLDGKEYIIQGSATDKSRGIKVRAEDGRVKAELKLEVKIKFIDRYIIIERAEGENVLRYLAEDLQNAFSDTFKSQLEAFAALSPRSDVLGIGTLLYRENPRAYADWGGDMEKVDYTFDVKVTVF